MSDLNLQNFSSVFEIFFGYHILLAFSEKLRNFLNVNAHVASLITNHSECKRYSTYLKGKSGKKKLFLLGYLSKAFLKSIDRGKSRFVEDKLFKLLKTSYIYFGLLSLTYLMLSGLLDVVVDDQHLMIINFISTIIAFYYLICSFRTSKHKVTWGSLRSFFGSIILIFSLIIIPTKFIEQISFFPLMPITIFSSFRVEGDRNILVFWSLILVLSPIIIEVIHIFLCALQLNILKYTTRFSFLLNEIYFSFTTLKKLRKATSEFKELDEFESSDKN